jgi:hypothetical protein
VKAIRLSLVAGCGLGSCLAQQDAGKLKARELFYSAVEAPAPQSHKAAKSTKAKTPHKTPVDAGQAAASRAPSGSGANLAAPVIPAAYKPKSPRPPLGLRYTILKRSGDGQVEISTDTVFHAGDRIRLAVETNDDGYLYVVNRGSSGTWKLLFPSPEIKDGDNRIGRRTRYEIPSGYTFTFDEQAGEEKLFIVLSRQPEPDLERLIYNLGQGGKPAEAKPEAGQPKMLLASAAFNDDVIGKLRNAYARDLIVEKVDEDQAGPNQEKAVYAVNPSGSADSRVVADITLKHQ